MATKTKPTIILTGDERTEAPKAHASTPAVDWKIVPLLSFERLPIDPAVLEQAQSKPFEWVVFTSPRAVRFWSETWLEAGAEPPLETQVACIGTRTADAAALDGFNADFYPTEPGTEAFLAEFNDLIVNTPNRPTVWMPMAEGGRPDLREGLTRLGCTVTWTPLYRTVPTPHWEERFADERWDDADLMVFTSPSSLEFFTARFALPSHVPIAAIGEYTGESLRAKGVADPLTVPGGDLRRAPELLNASGRMH